MQPWKDQLRESFKSYLEYVALNLRKEPPKEKESDKQMYLAHIDQPSRLRAIIEKMENSVEFKNLVSSFSTALGRDPKKAIKERYGIKTFFRRSKLYLNIYEGKAVSIEDVFDKLCSVFNERQIKILTLRLIEDVDFRDDLIDFGTFSIERFSKAELDELIGNQVNSIFYPYAGLDTDKLCLYWFIKEERYEKRNKGDFFSIHIGDWDDFSRVSRTFPDRTLQLLALFDWETKWRVGKTDDIKKDTGWLGFSTPIMLKITDDIFETPSPSPDLSGLEIYPLVDASGEDIGEAPTFLIDLKKDELERLKNIVIKTKRFLDSIDLTECDLEFLNIGMGYLAKAFFTEGLEQLLWHMTVLDALFGERDEVTASLKRRISNIFGKTEKARKEIRKKVDDLYQFRSDLVHGNIFKDEVFKGHLRIARTFARDSLLWFLNLLSTIHEELTRANIPFKNYPKRKELLFLLDSEKSDLERFKILIQNLPKDFPDHG